MKNREFEQEWIDRRSPINHGVECNVIFDMLDYMTNLHLDLKAIQKFNAEEFKKLSGKDIQSYISKFESLREKFCIICKEDYLTQGISIHDMSEYRKGLVEKTETGFKISDKYFKDLKKIAEKIFDLETEVQHTTDKLWAKRVNGVSSYDKKGEYFMLAHADYKTTKSEDLPQNIKEYSEKQQGICFSVVSNQKTKLYEQDKNFCRGIVGIIAKPKADGIVGISRHDMISIEFCDGKCELPDQFWHSKVDKCFDNGTSQIYCSGTKICPPDSIFDTCADTINEVILDKSKIDVLAVFYVTDSYHEIPKRLEEYRKEQEALVGHSLPVIELEPKNRLHQYDLENMF